MVEGEVRVWVAIAAAATGAAMQIVGAFLVRDKVVSEGVQTRGMLLMLLAVVLAV